MAKERLHYIDIFKGICLILVVIHHAPLAYKGHFVQQGSVLWYINNFAKLFLLSARFHISFFYVFWTNIERTRNENQQHSKTSISPFCAACLIPAINRHRYTNSYKNYYCQTVYVAIICSSIVGWKYYCVVFISIDF